ncbi:TonB-dependent receptor plug domain-containing protein [Achromobacter xylosoxidans]|uniref:TonB-dependent receptor plug domain-containing protein n=1 Tax=Alcaligenes xylosoxydans xylosoxydans TaxID=85698 RepID=UPI0015673596|nr:TonB-dependent receptor plug domain-containing protein [Achromobacter xylosoxidans]QKI79182.1 TonB-dependent receptor plug domain-containing protein [Achromobacter xylosoxidans]
MYKRIARNALVASATLAAGNVNAQTSDSRHERQIELEPVVVSATRQETNAADVAGTVNVISRKRMDAWQVNSTEDLVRHEPGLTIKRNTSGTDPFGNLGSFQIRGVGANRVQIRVDGARIQEQIQDGNRNFVDLSTLKSVEIMHGPASVLWGADALGGLVLYRTLDPEDLLNGTSNPYAGQAGLGYDSFNSSWRESAALGFQLAPTLQGLVMYNHDQGHEGKLRRARADGGVWGCPAASMPSAAMNSIPWTWLPTALWESWCGGQTGIIGSS